KKITLIRDLRGRIRLLLPGEESDYPGEKKSRLSALCRDLSPALGTYGFPPDRMVLFEKAMFLGDPQVVLRDAILKYKREGFTIQLLDRQVTGQDWLKEPLEQKATNPRVTFYGIKGGVGRSTALIIWAWWLARQGKKVLLFDLDLESPGVSSTLLPNAMLPNYGIVDWFVEDGVGQAESIEREMTAASPLSQELPGEIRIVPAFGATTREYLPKLARCYTDTINSSFESWSGRLERMVSRIEKPFKPDITLLDSRAGIHDIAAAVITRMESLVLLFAVNSPQTWKAYQFLFQYWKQQSNLVFHLRERIKIVASMIPETSRDEYMTRFTEHAWDLFRDEIYDTAEPNNPDAFSYDLNDHDAPHSPLPIFWHRALQEFDPIREKNGWDEKTARDSMELFMDQMVSLIHEME
ncbi:MAG: AAA family ATPase, partial [Candidatus Omnitrophica bacterium]|nr:AAA family ATPase [Candidatus Omnitrophota bacterium]